MEEIFLKDLSIFYEILQMKILFHPFGRDLPKIFFPKYFCILIISFKKVAEKKTQMMMLKVIWFFKRFYLFKDKLFSPKYFLISSFKKVAEKEYSNDDDVESDMIFQKILSIQR